MDTAHTGSIQYTYNIAVGSCVSLIIYTTADDLLVVLYYTYKFKMCVCLCICTHELLYWPATSKKKSVFFTPPRENNNITYSLLCVCVCVCLVNSGDDIYLVVVASLTWSDVKTRRAYYY